MHIDLAPDYEITRAFENSKLPRTPANLRTELRKFLPHRLADRWLDLHPPNSWTNQALADFEKQIHDWPITPSGTEGYEKAEVTAGGIDPNELSAKTMESKKIPGLFFIGEVVDVTGQLGGFNFQWAWASGAAAGRSL
jgi:predicted flavoprotein YhiN